MPLRPMFKPFHAYGKGRLKGSGSSQSHHGSWGEGRSSRPGLHTRSSFWLEPKETHTVAIDRDERTGNKIINGEYEIIDELGRGEHGKVKLGVHIKSGRTVAIKVIQRYAKTRRLGKVDIPEDKVKKEVAILKKARHPNVVSLLEVIDDPTRQKAYIVLEYVENGEIIWRKKGLKEIVTVDMRRLERERTGNECDSKTFMEECRQYVAHEQQQRRKMELMQEAKRKSFFDASRHGFHNWSLELGGDSDDDYDIDNYEARASSPPLDPFDKPLYMNDVDQITAPQAVLNHNYQSNFMAGSPGLWTRRQSDLSDFSDHNTFYDDDDLSYVPCLTIRQARSAFCDALLGLEYLHYQGIIHRDIKPANLLLSKDKHVKISDFGVSYLGRPIREGQEDGKGSDEVDRELSKTVGTPAFYAPELCYTGPENDDEPYIAPKITGAIDIWSLGVTLYAMIFGRLPFTANNYSLFRNIVHAPVYVPKKRLKPVEVSSKRLNGLGSSQSKQEHPKDLDKRLDGELAYEDIDDDLADLIRRLLAKDPMKRVSLKEIKKHPWVSSVLDPEKR